MWERYSRIARPMETHNVKTPARYLEVQAAIIRTNMERLPARGWRLPFNSSKTVVPFVNGGRWIVVCPDCGNAPSYDPEWKLACCCECGAIYRDVEPPSGYKSVETLLMKRPKSGNRHWFPDRESAEDILRENVAHEIGGL